MPTWAGGAWPFAVVAVVAFIFSTKLSIRGYKQATLYTRNRIVE
jgi:hypothetical protein